MTRTKFLIGEDYDAEEEENGLSKSDSELMPPPPLPKTSESGGGPPPSATITATNVTTASTTTTSASTTTSTSRRPITPLAAMLPSKYLNVNVKEIFPDFRPDAVSMQNVFFVYFLKWLVMK